MLPFVDAGTLDALARAWSDWMMDATLRGSAALAIGGLAAVLLRRRSASARHLVWTLGVVGLLALPLLAAVVPAWKTPVPMDWMPASARMEAEEPKRTIDPDRVVRNQDPGTGMKLASFPGDATPKPRDKAQDTRGAGEDQATATYFQDDSPTFAQAAFSDLGDTLRGLSFTGWLLLVWETGLLLTLSFFGIGAVRLWWLARQSRPLEHPRWDDLLGDLKDGLGIGIPVELRVANGPITPMTWGIRRAVVLLPPDALTWDDAVRHDVLLHELTHIQRRDALTQALAQLACAIHWFNPLVWIATAQMRVERERACDDRVLMAGSKASSYASHLLEMARSLRSESCTSFATLAMARRSQLSDRLMSVLDTGRHRGTPGRFGAGLLTLLGLLVVVPLAAWSPVAEEPPRALAAEPVVEVAPAPEPVFLVPDADRPALLRREHARRHAELHDHSECVFGAHGESVAPKVVELPGGVALLGREPYAVAVPAPDRTDRDDNAEPTRGVAKAPVAYISGQHSGPVYIAPDARTLAVDPPVAPRAYAVAQSSSRTSVGDRIRNFFGGGNRSTWVHHDDGYKISVEMEGEIEFSEDETSLLAMSDDGWFELEERLHRDRRRVTVEMDDGELLYTFYEGRRRVDDDAEARAWLADVLPDAMRSMGINIDKRVARIYGQGGVDALIEEMDELRSDYTLGRYLKETMALDAASAEDKQAVLREFLPEMDSDYETANVMITAMPLVLSDPVMRAELPEILDDIDSDYESRRVLSTAMDEGGFETPEMVAIVEAARDIDSDYELTQFLLMTDPYHLEDQDFRLAFFDAVESIDSDYERGRLLQHVLEEGHEDPQTLEFVLRAVEDIDSDYESAQVLTRTANLFLEDEQALRRFFDAVSEIHSDFERGRVLKSLMGRRSLPESALAPLLLAIEDTHSEFERANLLIGFADLDNLPEEVREDLMHAIDDLRSQHEYGRAMKAARRNLR